MTIISYKYRPNIFFRRGDVKISFSSRTRERSIFYKKGISSYFKILAAFIIVFFIFYVIIVHQGVVFGYKIEQEKKAIVNYEIENQNLKAELSSLLSISSLSELAKARGLEVENKPIYIKINSVKIASASQN